MEIWPNEVCDTSNLSEKSSCSSYPSSHTIFEPGWFMTIDTIVALRID